MAMLSDCSVGFKFENVAYGTAVTVDRWPEFVEEGFVQENEYIDSDGLRVGGIGVDLSRRTLGKVVASGSLGLEWVTRGLGMMLYAMLGTASSTLRTGAIYQQLATPSTSDRPPSFTVQKGVVASNSGTVRQHTFLGCCVDSWKFSAQSGEALMLETDWVCKEMETTTAYAAPSYVASPRTLAYPHMRMWLGLNGSDTLTLPTATTLGSTTGSELITANKIELTGNNNLDDGGYNSGGAGKRNRSPAFGIREFGGSFTTELGPNTHVVRDYYLAQNDLHLIVQFTSDQDNIGASGTYAALQFVYPSVRLEGAVPTAGKGGDVPEFDVGFTAGRTASAQTIYVAAVTADTAL